MSLKPIIIIDDDVDQLTLLASMLNELSYPIMTVLDGKRALELLRQETPALVITDMVLPTISGAELIRAIRSDSQLQSTKIVIITSFLKYITQTDRDLVDEVFAKPVQKDEFVRTVKELLAKIL